MQPRKGDTVRVLRGEGVGLIASLIGLDGADGILRFAQQDAKNDVKILQLSNLGLIITEGQAL